MKKALLIIFFIIALIFIIFESLVEMYIIFFGVTFLAGFIGKK